MIRVWAFFFAVVVFSLTLVAQTPQSYERLAKAYEKDKLTLQQLRRHPYFQPYMPILDRYESEVVTTFTLGYQLDKAIEEHSGETKALSRSYLEKLRGLGKHQQEVEHLYEQALTYAMQNDDLNLFELLLQNGMQPIENRRIRKRLQQYYKKQRAYRRIAVAETLLKELALEERSRKEAMQEMAAYEVNLRVIAEAEAERIRKMTADKRTRNVIVSTRKLNNGYAFIADNLNSYRVTITLDFDELDNLQTSASLPVTIELPPKNTVEVLRVGVIDPQKRVSFSSSFGWVMGSLTARHDDSINYRLPFASGSSVVVSQGFDGANTHTGLSRYAVDFPVPEGTPVHAARGGTVVAVESRNDKGGYSKSYGQYANYIIIEHADLTLGKYYHLRQNGAVVNVGDVVETGQMIGYSGNTGYSSGPHLHFSVSKVDPGTKRRPMTVPFRFKTRDKLVTEPKRGDKYVASL